MVALYGLFCLFNCNQALSINCFQRSIQLDTGNNIAWMGMALSLANQLQF